MSNLNIELINQIKLIADEKKIPQDSVADALKEAIVKAYVREMPETNIEVKIDIDNKTITCNKLLNVVEDYEDLNDYSEISVENAKKIDENLKVGDIYYEHIDLNKLSRPVVSHILQIFKNLISTQTNLGVYREWKDKVNTVIYAEVEKIDARSKFVLVNLGSTFGFMRSSDSIQGENLKPGKKYYFYIKEVIEQTKGWPIILSRAHTGLISYLLEQNVPEIADKIVEIKAIGRVAGEKTKVVVLSKKFGVDAVSAVLGEKSYRVKEVSKLINNEPIEVVSYDDDFSKYIVNICSPADIVGYKIYDETQNNNYKTISIICYPDKLKLLIGKKGVNARIISQILKAEIDIKTVSDATKEELVYEKVERKNFREKRFISTYEKHKSNSKDFFDNFNNWNIDLSNKKTDKKENDK